MARFSPLGNPGQRVSAREQRTRVPWLRRIPSMDFLGISPFSSASSAASGVQKLDTIFVREEFHDRRRELLAGDQHNLEILGPYAQLHLCVKEARRLLPLDCCGTSDPYVEVFVNDVPLRRTPHMPRTLSPTWHEDFVLDIWSPFSIIRVAVMDWDRFSEDDFIGFVEFRVAELEPNGPQAAGWFELRLADRFKGTARHRFRRHRRARDDALAPPEAGPGADAAAELAASSRDDEAALPNFPTSPYDGTRSTCSTLSASSVTGGVLPMRSTKRFRVQRRRVTACCGRLPTDLYEDWRSRREPPGAQDTTAPPVPHLAALDAQGRRLNAGEIYLTLRLETAARPNNDGTASIGLFRALLGAVLWPSLLLERCEEEWFACCLPRPEFEAPGDEDEEGGAFSLQDIRDFYESASALKAAVLECVLWPLLSALLFVVTWRELAVSSAALAYWLAFCLWPCDLLPSLPLCLALWLRLLRDRRWCNALLVREQTAPLTEEGFAIVAALRSSKCMAKWLRRLVKDRGGWVDKMGCLSDFARLTHKDGRPTLSFEALLEDIGSRPWISWGVARGKHCREGHVLQLLGTGAFRMDGGWRCAGPPGQGEEACVAGVYKDGLHLGTKRYRCPACGLDFCGICAAGGRAPASLMRLDTSKLPLSGTVMMRAMKDFVVEHEDLVEDCRELAEGALCALEQLCSPGEADLARRTYASCAATSAMLFVVRALLRSRAGPALLWFWSLAWMAVGCGLMLQQAAPVQRLRTAYRASADLARCQELRQRGGCARWQFFSPDASAALHGPEEQGFWPSYGTE